MRTMEIWFCFETLEAECSSAYSVSLLTYNMLLGAVLSGAGKLDF